MKSLKPYILVITLLFLNEYSFSQIPPEVDQFQFLIKKDFDSLKAKTNLILHNKLKEDLPYYDEVSFIKDAGIDKYILFYKEEDNNVKMRIQSEKNFNILVDTIRKDGFTLFKIDPEYYGEVKLICYSKEPNNKWFYISELDDKNTNEKIKIPNAPINLLQYRMLKEYKLKATKDDIPTLKEFSYVFTKNRTYLFKIEGDKDLGFKLYDNERNRMDLRAINDTTYLYQTPETGIFYMVYYKKDALTKDSKVTFYYK